MTEQEWNKLVSMVYKKPYELKKQKHHEGKKEVTLLIPSDTYDYENRSVSEINGGLSAGVCFDSWLRKNVNKELDDPTLNKTEWWKSRFYPEIQTLANDLWVKNIVKPGRYSILIE